MAQVKELVDMDERSIHQVHHIHVEIFCVLLVV